MTRSPAVCALRPIARSGRPKRSARDPRATARARDAATDQPRWPQRCRAPAPPGLVTLGLAATAGDGIRPLSVIRPQSFVDTTGAGEWWVASDLDEAALGGPLPEDHVLGVGGASLTLASLQLPTPAARGLDIGTGCGIQALRARRSISHIVATDISERALRLHATECAAQRRRRDRAATREPLRPCRGRAVRSDRLQSAVRHHPPGGGRSGIRIPRRRLIGDDLVAAFVRSVGAHLAPGGVAQLLGNWETRGRSRRTRPGARVGLGFARCRWTPGWSSARSSIHSLTPSSGYVTAGHCPDHPDSRALWMPGSTTSRRAKSARSASDTCCCGVRSRATPTLARFESLPAGARRRRPRRSISPRRSPRTTYSPNSTTRGSRHPSSSSRPT